MIGNLEDIKSCQAAISKYLQDALQVASAVDSLIILDLIEKSSILANNMDVFINAKKVDEKK